MIVDTGNPDYDLLINTLAGPLIGGLLALLSLVFSLRAGKRLRLVENLPTSKTTGVFIGLVELKGTAESEAPLTSHLAGRPCVHYQWSVEEHWSRTVTETYRDSKGHTRTRTRHESGWKTVASGGESAPFYLQDDCGVILVRPDRADIHPTTSMEQTVGTSHPLYYGKGPSGAILNSDHRRRFVERIIPLHAPLYIMGPARERADIVAAEIAHAPDAELYLISTHSEERVGSRFRWTFRSLWLLGLALSIGGFAAQSHMLQHDWRADVSVWLSAAGVYIVTGLLGWVWMMYNSMVSLRARVRQAWANVDVQLKRRSDLIPNLVAIAGGFGSHEKDLHTELAGLRAQLTATAPGQPGPDPRACAGNLTAIVEQYPELKANESFLALQKNLIETEDRIGLARDYFNSIATFYNTRLEVLPDRFIAALGAMQPAPLLGSNDFERQPVQVNLAE